VANTHRIPNKTLILRTSLTALIILVLGLGMTASLAYAEASPIERSESVALHTGDWLSVSSNRESLQIVEIRGNMSASKMSSPQTYPTHSFNFTSDASSRYSIRLTFEYPSEYGVTILTYGSDTTKQEQASYYVSSGQLLLTIDLNFEALEPATPASTSSIIRSFTSWTTRFGDAFPLWVKLLYILLGIQFVAVGYKWITFENSTRQEDSLVSRFDTGNLLYLWCEILFKFLLAAFLVIAVAMGGQLILISVLKFMFLAPVNMLSLWDLFVLGFAAGITVIAYVWKVFLEKTFDLKPLFQE